MKGVYIADYLIFLWGQERAHVTDCLIGADQKIPDRLVKTTFLGEVESSARSGINPRFGGLS